MYECHVTQYNPETGEGGIFDVYLNTFLKLEAKASGYPGWVHSPENEDLYVHCEGIRLDKEAIRYNAAKQVLAKLFLNSMW